MKLKHGMMFLRQMLKVKNQSVWERFWREILMVIGVLLQEQVSGINASYSGIYDAEE